MFYQEGLFMSIKLKIVLFVAIFVFLAFSTTTWIIHHNTSKAAKTLAYQLTEETAKKNALMIQLELERIMEKARGLTLTFTEMLNSSKADRELLDNILIRTIPSDPGVLDTWTVWEPNAFDGKDADYVNAYGHDATGQVNSYWHWNDVGEIVVEPNVNWKTADYYQLPKKNKHETLIDPYLYKISGAETLFVSAAVPIMYKNQFLGVVGIDYKLDTLRKKVTELRILGTGYAELLANNGTYVAHVNEDYIGKSIMESDEADELAKQAIMQGNIYTRTVYSKRNQGEVYRVFVPIHVGDTRTPWSLEVNIPIETVLAPATQVTHSTIMISGISLGLILIMLWFVINNITAPITNITQLLRKITHSNNLLKEVHTLPVETKDEVGQLAKIFNQMSAEVHRQFAERSETESKLQQAFNELKQFQTTLDMTVDSVFMFRERELTFFYANQGASQQLGYSREEFMHMSPLSIKPNTSQAEFNTLIQPLIAGEKTSVAFETIHRHKNGTRIPVDIVLQYISISGQENCFVAIVRNITERKQAEQFLKEYNQRLEQEVSAQMEELAAQTEELTESYQSLEHQTEQLRQKEEFLKLIIDNMPQLIFWKDINSVYLGCNQKVVEMNKVNSSEDIIGKTDFDLVWKDWAKKYRMDDRRIMDNDGAELRFLEQLIQSNGSSCWVETNKIPLHDASGKVMGILGTVEDVTERKQAEELQKEYRQRLEKEVAKQTLVLKDKTNLLENEQEKFSVVMDSLESIVYVADMETYEVLFVNKYTRDLFDDKMIGKTCWKTLQQGKTRPCEFCTNSKLVDSEGQPTGLYTWEFQNTITKSWFYLQDRAIRWTDGRLVRLEIGTNITQLKESEMALQEAKLAAEMANQAKSTFLANMSHELRTPLNGILGYAQILKRDRELTPKQLEGVNIIQRSGDYLLTLINDILDLSKIEANRVELYSTDFRLNEFLQGIVELFQMRAEQKGITFIYEPLTHLPEGIRADEKRLRQVLINLLTNAVKFTDQGGVSLKVGCEEGKIRFHVSDTGIGIIKEDLEKIFHPFQQSGDFLHKAEGTGLGLSITQRIIEMMGGHIHVESELGKGSTFWFTIKLEEVSDLVKTHVAELHAVITGFQEAPKKLLVIDDKWENRSVMKNLLEPLGFEIIEAVNGQEGVERAIEIKPDLIMTDLVMPIMDGFEVVRRLRKLPGLKHKPIIAVTASVFDYDQEQSYAAGCDAFVPKPFRAEVLLNYLQTFLKLTWIYDQNLQLDLNNKETSEEETVIEASNEDWVLTFEQAGNIFKLAMQGDTIGIKTYVTELAKADKMFSGLAKTVIKLADNFEDEQICELVEPFLDETEETPVE